MTKRKDLKKRLMEDPEFREEHARADDEFALIEALVRARAAAKLTQTEFARRLGRTRSAIAGLEGGGCRRRSRRCAVTRKRPARGWRWGWSGPRVETASWRANPSPVCRRIGKGASRSAGAPSASDRRASP